MKTATDIPGDVSKWLSIYVRDHLAGAAGGVALFRRAARSAPDGERAAVIRRLADDVAEDAVQLRRYASALGIRRPRLREFVAVAAERVARGKLNGRILKRSPLSSVMEVEAMILGVTGKMLAWRSLTASGAADGLSVDTDLDQLESRAVEQRRELEQLHRDVIRDVFGARTSVQ